MGKIFDRKGPTLYLWCALATYVAGTDLLYAGLMSEEKQLVELAKMKDAQGFDEHAALFNNVMGRCLGPISGNMNHIDEFRIVTRIFNHAYESTDDYHWSFSNQLKSFAQAIFAFVNRGYPKVTGSQLRWEDLVAVMIIANRGKVLPDRRLQKVVLDSLNIELNLRRTLKPVEIYTIDKFLLTIDETAQSSEIIGVTRKFLSILRSELSANRLVLRDFIDLGSRMVLSQSNAILIAIYNSALSLHLNSLISKDSQNDRGQVLSLIFSDDVKSKAFVASMNPKNRTLWFLLLRNVAKQEPEHFTELSRLMEYPEVRQFEAEIGFYALLREQIESELSNSRNLYFSVELLLNDFHFGNFRQLFPTLVAKLLSIYPTLFFTINQYDDFEVYIKYGITCLQSRIDCAGQSLRFWSQYQVGLRRRILDTEKLNGFVLNSMGKIVSGLVRNNVELDTAMIAKLLAMLSYRTTYSARELASLCVLFEAILDYFVKSNEVAFLEFADQIFVRSLDAESVAATQRQQAVVLRLMNSNPHLRQFASVNNWLVSSSTCETHL